MSVSLVLSDETPCAFVCVCMRDVRTRSRRHAAQSFSNSTHYVRTAEIVMGWDSECIQRHREHWGTKWDTRSAQLDEREDALTYTFDTAWSPPLEWAVAASAAHPDLQLTLRFEEDVRCHTRACGAPRVHLPSKRTPTILRWSPQSTRKASHG